MHFANRLPFSSKI